MKDSVQLILTSLSVAAFSFQVASLSTLSEKIKVFLGLNQPYKLDVLLNRKAWGKIVGPFWSYVFIPFIILLHLHKFLSELLSCPYCLSIWIMFPILFFGFGYELLSSVVYTPLALVGVTIIDRIIR